MTVRESPRVPHLATPGLLARNREVNRVQVSVGDVRRHVSLG